jgi:two-component system, NarL family, nitrate/nitrite response regulator NarL
MSTLCPQSIRVLIVDDHGIVRAGLHMLLESQPGITVVGEAATCAEALALATREQPDVIVLDLDLGGENAIESIPALLSAAPETRILVLTGVRDPEAHREAVRHGAIGLVLKEKAVATLLQAITRVGTGEVWLEPTMVARVLGELTRPQTSPPISPEAAKIATLTEREREVITLVGEGLRNKHIAERLYISEATVRHHLTAIFAKLDVADRFELAIYAYQHGLAKPPG